MSLVAMAWHPFEESKQADSTLLAGLRAAECIPRVSTVAGPTLATSNYR